MKLKSVLVADVLINLGLMLLLLTGVLTPVSTFGAYLILSVIKVDVTAIICIVKIVKLLIKKIKSRKKA